MIEAGPRDRPLGEDGLTRLLEELSDEAAERVVAGVDAAAEEISTGRARDDVALLAVHTLPAAARPAAAELTLPAVPDSLHVLREAVVEEAARVPGVNPEDVRLAVGEACANAVVHAYRSDDGPGMIHLRTFTVDGSFVVEVRDEGCGPAPREDSPGLGLGLPLMAKLSRDLQVTERERTGTLVRMVF